MARVYTSSTYLDLQDYIKKVYQTFRQFGHDVIAMEDYLSTDSCFFDKCLECVANCGCYAAVFARCYGEMLEGQTKSITELECADAVAAESPR